MDYDNSLKLKVGIAGATGKMGQATVKAVLADPNLQLVMATGRSHLGEDVAVMAGLKDEINVPVRSDLEAALKETQPQVVVDFTVPELVLKNTLLYVQNDIFSVVGTTGLSPSDMKTLENLLAGKQLAVLVAPNFAIGAVLLMKFAQEASKYFDHAEIIELHHNQKLDAPSGTALRTAELMQAVQPAFGPTNVDSSQEKEIITGARGATTTGNLHIHSLRLPGLVAHEEVIFGGVGQTLTIRHDSLDRTSFMPGVILAVKKLVGRTGLIYGLENLL